MIEPGKKRPIYLDCDANVPESMRPVFWLRTMSWRGQLEYTEAFDALYADGVDHKSFRDWSLEMCRILNMAYCGWDRCCDHATGVQIPFSEDSWMDVLTGVSDSQELIRKALLAGRVSGEEKKSCELQQPSGPESSAGTVTEDAKTEKASSSNVQAVTGSDAVNAMVGSTS